MKTRLKRRLLLSLAFGAAVFIALTVIADAEKLAAAFARFPWGYLPLLLACASANYTLRFWKWDYYTRVLAIRPPARKNLIIFLASFIMAVTPGKLGEVLKSYLLKEVNGTPISKSAPVILAERLTDFIGLTVIVVIGAFVFEQARTVVVGFAAFFLAITILLSMRNVSLRILAVFDRSRFFRRFSRNIRTAYDSIYLLVRPRPFAWSSAISIGSWFFECLAYWLVLRAFHAPVPILKASFIYAFSTIVGAVSMLPGGLGTTEGSLTGLATLAGTPIDIAVASTFIIRACTLWYAVLIGVAITFFFQHRLHVRIDDIDIDAVNAG
ncbi:MAG: lysylphosphatidylglycerol synthase transmembrane domain-containing protein [Bacteroidota bacterium]|nr:lysylphosphatidylglycerol synthase transmembrane domain-containing protein [Bacteroidota bacterium]